MYTKFAGVFKILLMVVSAVHAAGCGPYVYYRADIPQSARQARRALEVLAANPRPLRRPLLLIHGWRDSARRWQPMLAWLRRCTTNAPEMVYVCDYEGDQPIAGLVDDLFAEFSIEGEVDVVGHSMGGLIARQANRKGYIKVRQLFSMASPHHGSYLARYNPLFRQLRDMTPGSEFLKNLNSDPNSRNFRIVTYWMKGDFLLTQGSSESLGGTNIVMSHGPKPLFRYTHNQLVMDERTIFDVIRRLTSNPNDLQAPVAPRSIKDDIEAPGQPQAASEKAEP